MLRLASIGGKGYGVPLSGCLPLCVRFSESVRVCTGHCRFMFRIAPHSVPLGLARLRLASLGGVRSLFTSCVAHLPPVCLTLRSLHYHPSRILYVSSQFVPCLCVCVFSSHSFWTSSSLDVPTGVTQEEGHTGFLIHLLSAVLALIFLARRIQPFLSLVDREVEFCVLTN